jgi:hypothetical protein
MSRATPLKRRSVRLRRGSVGATLFMLAMIRKARVLMLVALAAAAVFSGSCATVARVVNLTEPLCNASFEARLSSILTESGEKPDVADSLAHRAYLTLTRADYGPRPFFVGSPSGTDFTFFVQKKHDRCLLRLYARQKGFMSYTNNLTYISTRELPGCACAE